MAREAKAVVEGAGRGDIEEVVVDPEDDDEAWEDEPPEASAELAASGSAGGETGVSKGTDVGAGGGETVPADEVEDGSPVDGEKAGSEEAATPDDIAAESGEENETGWRGGGGWVEGGTAGPAGDRRGEASGREPSRGDEGNGPRKVDQYRSE